MANTPRTEGNAVNTKSPAECNEGLGLSRGCTSNAGLGSSAPLSSNQVTDLMRSVRMGQYAKTFSLSHDSAITLVQEIDRLRIGIQRLQATCCGSSDEKCNGCRALLALVDGAQLPAETGDDLDGVIADVRSTLAEFNSEDVRVMATRAVDLIADLRATIHRMDEVTMAKSRKLKELGFDWYEQSPQKSEGNPFSDLPVEQNT